VTATMAAKITREASDGQSFLAISDIFGGSLGRGLVGYSVTLVSAGEYWTEGKEKGSGC
jgi:hypothetical protein